MKPLRPPLLAPVVLAALAVTVPLVGGCTTASSLELTPRPVDVSHRLAGTVRVEAVGSPRKFGIGAPSIGGAGVAAALRGAILDSGLADGVVESGAADHVLRVAILEAQRSDLQLDMEAEVSARWTLFDGDGRVTRWTRLVESKGKATTFDAGMVEDRARMALEDAVRKNLEQGLAALGAWGGPSSAP